MHLNAHNVIYTSCTVDCTQSATCPEHATCEYGNETANGTQNWGGACNAVAPTCSITNLTCDTGYHLNGMTCELDGAKCDAGYWLNGDTCEICPVGSYCVNDVKTECDAGYTTNTTGASERNQCYTTCSVPCVKSGCQSNAICEYDTTNIIGEQFFGGACNAVASACDITSVVCNTNYEMVDGVCVSTVQESEFVITTTKIASGGSFSFSMSAAGTFYIDWGDGSEIQVVNKTNTNMETFSHPYTASEPRAYDIKLTGQATQYHAGSSAAISFSNNKQVAGIAGSLGALFPTLADGSNPIFYQTFYMCTSLQSSIPPHLFTGIYGTAPAWMFRSTFEGCSGLTGEIPSGLFAGITGMSVKYAFYNTFYKCSGLTGTIPSDLFAGFSGALTSTMFTGTFRMCSGLSGYVPWNLFENIDTSSFKNGVMKQIFEGSGLDTLCPANTYQYITGFENDFSGKVACAPCPDGGQSPAGSTNINQCSGGIVSCIAGEYKNENDQCIACPDNTPNSVSGATDVGMCFAGNMRLLHIDNLTVGLLETQRTQPALHVMVDDTIYYGALTTQETDVNSSDDKQIKILYNNTLYYLYDQTRLVI